MHPPGCSYLFDKQAISKHITHYGVRIAIQRAPGQLQDLERPYLAVANHVLCLAPIHSLAGEINRPGTPQFSDHIGIAPVLAGPLLGVIYKPARPHSAERVIANGFEGDDLGAGLVWVRHLNGSHLRIDWKIRRAAVIYRVSSSVFPASTASTAACSSVSKETVCAPIVGRSNRASCFGRAALTTTAPLAIAAPRWIVASVPSAASTAR